MTALVAETGLRPDLDDLYNYQERLAILGWSHWSDQDRELITERPDLHEIAMHSVNVSRRMQQAAALEEFLDHPDDQADCLNYLQAKGWLRRGRSIACTSPKILERAAQNPQGFFQAVREWRAAQ